MTDEELRAWADARAGRAPTRSEADALVGRAERRRRAGWLWWLWVPVIPVGLGAAAAAVVLGVWLTRPAAPVAPAVVVAPEGVAPVAAPRSLPPGVHVVGDDQVEVGAGGEVVLTAPGPEAVWTLTRGSVAVAAATRAPGEQLTVTSDDWTVRVVGTRFVVTHAPFTVRVDEGVVQVGRGAERWTVRAGDRFERGVVVRPPPPPALPEVEALRQQVLGGDRQGARAGLHQRLAARPGDADAWTLLAQLEARDGRPDDAVAAWREVIARGSPAAAQRARFEAAVLLERRPAEVIPLLEVFLASPDPLAAEAGLRLGRARLAVGDREGAVRALEQVAREHPGTGPAAEAMQLSK